MKSKGVIVIGGHVQGLGIIRVFGQMGIPCVLLDDTPINIAKHSKYCKNFIRYKKNELIECLNSLIEENLYHDWLIIPTNDFQVKELSINKKIIEKHFKSSVGEWSFIEKCYNKKLTYSIAQDLSIDMPITYFPIDMEELKQTEIVFPCIIKPAIMHKFYQKTKKKVFLCNDKKELIANYKKAQTIIPADEIIVQEVIPGSEKQQYSACFHFEKDKSLVSILANRIRQHPLDFGNATTYAETCTNPNLVNQAIKLLNEIEYRGLCEVEFKKDLRDGKYKLLEINPRTWKWHYLASASNSPFLESLYEKTYHNRHLVKNDWDEGRWQHLLTDIYVQFRLAIKGKKISSSKKGKKVYAVYDRNDLKPFVFEKLAIFYLMFTR